MPIVYIEAQQASISNGSAVVSVSGESVDFSGIQEGFMVVLDGLYVVPALSGTAPDGSGDSTLTLKDDWDKATLSNVKLLSFPTFAKVSDAVISMTDLSNVTRGVLQKFNDLLTDTNATINIPIGQSQSIDVPPWGYLEGLVNAALQSGEADLSRARITHATPRLYFEPGASHYNWKVAAQETDAALEISVGEQDDDALDDTYAPILSLLQSGCLNVNGSARDAALGIKNSKQFDPSDIASTDHLHLEQDGGTQGDGNYGSAIVLTKINSARRMGVLSSIQTDTDANRGGLAFFVHPSNTSTNLVELAAVLDHSKNLVMQGGGVGFGNEILQDYEEGTFTPGITFVTPGDLDVTYSVQLGWFTRIGNRYFCDFAIATATFTHTTASGSLRITGAPDTIKNVANYIPNAAVHFGGITKTGFTQLTTQPAINTTYLNVRASGSGQTPDHVSAADMPDSGAVVLRGQFQFEV